VTLSASHLDPSLALGFLLRSRGELLDLLDRVNAAAGAAGAGAAALRATLVSAADFEPVAWDFDEEGAERGPEVWDADGVRRVDSLSDDEWCAIR